MTSISYLFGLALFLTILSILSMTAMKFLRFSDRPDLLLGVRRVKVRNSDRFSPR